MAISHPKKNGWDSLDRLPGSHQKPQFEDVSIKHQSDGVNWREEHHWFGKKHNTTDLAPYDINPDDQSTCKLLRKKTVNFLIWLNEQCPRMGSQRKDDYFLVDSDVFPIFKPYSQFWPQFSILDLMAVCWGYSHLIKILFLNLRLKNYSFWYYLDINP